MKTYIYLIIFTLFLIGNIPFQLLSQNKDSVNMNIKISPVFVPTFYKSFSDYEFDYFNLNYGFLIEYPLYKKFSLQFGFIETKNFIFTDCSNYKSFDPVNVVFNENIIYIKTYMYNKQINLNLKTKFIENKKYKNYFLFGISTFFNTAFNYEYKVRSYYGDSYYINETRNGFWNIEGEAVNLGLSNEYNILKHLNGKVDVVLNFGNFRSFRTFISLEIRTGFIIY
ncbi:MAG: hypothetical protein A2X08_06665 [Bacteroidetes bacterium GWA2_32_17]|nr:MAG: hypothetical protein A2X08_06665 [Bacteroidetes bacterium GWA2_32_17]